jgi:hypothetical protein
VDVVDWANDGITKGNETTKDAVDCQGGGSTDNDR